MSALAVGMHIRVHRLVPASEIDDFASLSGDVHPNHTDDDYMSRTPYGRRIAHGGLLMAYMTGTASDLLEQYDWPAAVSYGYDRVRFVGPVFVDDEVDVDYRITEFDEERNLFIAEIVITNGDGATVAVARHLLREVQA